LSRTSRSLCKVVLDTSALLVIGEYGNSPGLADALEGICDDLTLVTPRKVLDEVFRIALERGRRGLAARLFLKLVNDGYLNPEIVEVEGCVSTDECILKLALELKKSGERVIAVTLDRDLSESLKKLGVLCVTWWCSRKKFTLSSGPSREQ